MLFGLKGALTLKTETMAMGNNMSISFPDCALPYLLKNKHGSQTSCNSKTLEPSHGSGEVSDKEI